MIDRSHPLFEMLATYAWVMGCVQYWESNLATLSIMSEAVKSANRPDRHTPKGAQRPGEAVRSI